MNVGNVVISLDAHVVISKNAGKLPVVVSQLGEPSVDDYSASVKNPPIPLKGIQPLLRHLKEFLLMLIF